MRSATRLKARQVWFEEVLPDFDAATGIGAAHDRDLDNVIDTGLAVSLVELTGRARPNLGEIWHRRTDSHGGQILEALVLHAAALHSPGFGAKASHVQRWM